MYLKWSRLPVLKLQLYYKKYKLHRFKFITLKILPPRHDHLIAILPLSILRNNKIKKSTDSRDVIKMFLFIFLLV